MPKKVNEENIDPREVKEYGIKIPLGMSEEEAYGRISGQKVILRDYDANFPSF